MDLSEQRYMETLFPEGRNLPENSLTPCVVRKGGRTDVLFLIKADESLLADFRNGGSSAVPLTDMVVHWEKPSADPAPDLVLRLDMQYPGKTTVFETFISGTEPDKQGAIGRALLAVNRFGIFIAGNDFTFAAFQAYSWDSTSDLQLRRILLEAAVKG